MSSKLKFIEFASSPLRLLNEFCVKINKEKKEKNEEKEENVEFECISNDENTGIFTFRAIGFGITVTGSGRSKKHAKQEAAAKLLAELKASEEYSEKLPAEIPPVPQRTVENTEDNTKKNSEIKKKYVETADSAAITPLRVLNEFCFQQNKTEVNFESIPHEDNPKMFSFRATALDMTVIGSGRSKTDAKQDAAAKLAAMLKDTEKYGKLFTAEIPTTPQKSVDNISNLGTICIQQNWPLPKVEMLASSGYPHSPVYTYVCKVANIRCIATSSSKQGAKQSAALKMIEVIKGFQRKEEENQIDKTDAPMIKYYEVIKKQLPTYCPRVHDRLNYFFELPEEDREAARQILMDFFDTDKVITKDTVIKTCEALKLNYKIIDDECPPYHIFQLLGKHEIVIIEQLPVFYNRIIEFFITMLNVKEFDEHYILNNPDRCITGGASKKYRLLDDPYFSDDYIEY